MTPAPRITWRHARIAGVACLSFGLLVLVLTSSPAYAAGVILGPFAGGFTREWQSCCAQNSLSLAPFAVGGLLAGAAVQLAVPPSTPLLVRLRAIAWGTACASWCAFALFSYGHALE
jgi:hypothetical protein